MGSGHPGRKSLDRRVRAPLAVRCLGRRGQCQHGGKPAYKPIRIVHYTANKRELALELRAGLAGNGRIDASRGTASDKVPGTGSEPASVGQNASSTRGGGARPPGPVRTNRPVAAPAIQRGVDGSRWRRAWVDAGRPRRSQSNAGPHLLRATSPSTEERQTWTQCQQRKEEGGHGSRL